MRMSLGGILLSVLAVVLSPLAVYRLIVLVKTDEGPFELMHKLREATNQNNWVGRGVRCPNCLSFWFGGLVAVLLRFELGQVAVAGLGLSGLVVWAYRRGWIVP